MISINALVVLSRTEFPYMLVQYILYGKASFLWLKQRQLSCCNDFDMWGADVVIHSLWSHCLFFMVVVAFLQLCKLQEPHPTDLKLGGFFLETLHTKNKLRPKLSKSISFSILPLLISLARPNFLMKNPRYLSRQWPLDNCPQCLRSDTKVAASIAALYDDGTFQSEGRRHQLQRHHFGHGEALSSLVGLKWWKQKDLKKYNKPKRPPFF